MKTSEIEIGKEYAIQEGKYREPMRVVVVGKGWKENPYWHARADAYRFSPGGTLIAVAVQTHAQWRPAVYRAQAFRGEWEAVSAARAKADKAARAERLAEVERIEALEARRDKIEAWLTEFEGETQTLELCRSGAWGPIVDKVEVKLGLLERLVDTIREFSDDASVTGVR